jgi:hypothetical protein
MNVTSDGFVVREILDGMSRNELQTRSGARLAFAPDCGALRTPMVEETK